VGGTALGLLGAPVAGVRPAFAARRSLYSHARFTPVFRRRFRMVDGRNSWVVTLVRISDLKFCATGDNRKLRADVHVADGRPAAGQLRAAAAGLHTDDAVRRTRRRPQYLLGDRVPRSYFLTSTTQLTTTSRLSRWPM
jgi:hypothetical protein